MNLGELFFSIKTEGVEAVGSKLVSLGNTLADVGGKFTEYLTEPILDFAKNSIKTSATFGQQMSRVSAVTDATGKDFDKLKGLAIEMGSKTSKTATEAAEAIEYMGLAGWDLRQIQEGLEPILRASEAGMMDLGTTSDLVTDSMSALGLDTKDLGRYLDIAAKSQKTSNQSMQQFLEAMTTAGGSFKQFNIPLEEAGALLGILANRSFKGTEAGNALISIMANLTTGSGQAGKAMKQLGVKIYDSNGKFRGMSVILKELNKKFDGMTEAQRNTYIQMIGGKTRTKELNALLNGTKQELDKLTKGLYNADGSLNNMAKTMQNNLMGKITKLKSVFEGIAIQIGDRLSPIIEFFVGKLQNLSEWFFKLDGPIKNIMLIFAALIASIGPVITALGGIVTVIGTLVLGISGLIAFISTVGLPIIAIVIGVIVQLTAMFIAFVGPIAAVTAAFGALIVKTGILNWAFEKVNALLNAISAMINGNYKVAMDLLINKFGMSQQQAEIFAGKINTAKYWVGKLIEVVKSVSALLGAIFTADKQKMIDLLITKFGISKKESENFANKVMKLKDKIVELGNKMINAANGALPKIINQLINFAKWLYQNRDKVVLLIDKLVNLASWLLKNSDKIVALGKFLVSTGRTVVSFASIVSKHFKIVKGAIDVSMKAASKIIGTVTSTLKTMAAVAGRVAGALSSIKMPNLSGLGGLLGHATGIMNNPIGHYAMVGEAGPELMYIPKGANIYSNSATKRMVGSLGKTDLASQNMQNTYNIDKIQIDAKNVKEFNDIIKIFDSLKVEYNTRRF